MPSSILNINPVLKRMIKAFLGFLGVAVISFIVQVLIPQFGVLFPHLGFLQTMFGGATISALLGLEKSLETSTGANL